MSSLSLLPAVTIQSKHPLIQVLNGLAIVLASILLLNDHDWHKKICH